MKIAFTTLGCKLNYAETSTYERGFVSHGLEVVSWNEPADAYLINTCSVTEHADKKSRNLIRKAHKQAPEALIVVTGCYAELKSEEIAGIPGVSRVFRSAEKGQIVGETMKLLEGVNDVTTSAAVASAGDSPAAFAAYSSGERTRSFLKVQDGCDNFCAYCTVPFARGRSRNIAVAELVKQAEAIASEGIREIVLTGVNTGDFGRTTGESFLDLLKALNAVEGVERYRISSIEPNLITEEIVDWIASGTKFLPHFHIPLQTGCDELLKRVGRRYDTELFASRIDYIRSKMDRPGEPKVFFGIDVIVGLPGETDELFGKTYKFLAERIRPAFIHLFPYSRRPGTRAAQWKDQVQDSVKTARMERMEALCKSLHEEFVRENHGLASPVLWESVSGKMMSGYTANYIKVSRPYEPGLLNTVTEEII